MLVDLLLDMFIFWGWALKGVPLKWQNQVLLTWAEPKYLSLNEIYAQKYMKRLPFSLSETYE